MMAATARLGKARDPRPDFSPAILITHSVSRHFRCETAPERFAIHGARATIDALMIAIAKSGHRTAPRYGNLSNAMARMAKAPLMRAARTRGRPGGWRSILQIDPGHGPSLEVVVRTTETLARATLIAPKNAKRKHEDFSRQPQTRGDSGFLCPRGHLMFFEGKKIAHEYSKGPTSHAVPRLMDLS